MLIYPAKQNVHVILSGKVYIVSLSKEQYVNLQ